MLSQRTGKKPKQITREDHMKTATAKVLAFEDVRPEDFASHDIRVPRLAHKLNDAIEQVKPFFTEWMKASNVFKKNTEEVAHAIDRAFKIYNSSVDEPTRVGFARLFDETIPADAKSRDVE